MPNHPLTPPDELNSETHMLAREVDETVYHATIPAMRLACDLVKNGTQGDLDQAERTIGAVLDCQERRSGHPHRGNFLWEPEDETVEDLNAVQFILLDLIPILIQWEDRLSKSLAARVRDSIRLGLEEIERIDVHPAYTNIVLKDIANSILGGELLKDGRILKRGRNKLIRWLTQTDESGIPSEYNSPGYTAVAIRVLHQLYRLAKDRESAIRARTAATRLGLSYVLHLNPKTGRLAGPYSRAYLDTVFNTDLQEIDTAHEWFEDGTLPKWLEIILRVRPSHLRVLETADAKNGVAIATYHTPVYDFGIASQELTTQANRFIALQSNVCIAHYTRDDAPTGLFTTRYLTNDHWVGDYRQTSSRSASLLAEEGRFIGVQDGPRAIGLYAPRSPDAEGSGVDGWRRCSSAKAALIWDREDLIDEIHVDGKRVSNLPYDVPRDATVIVTSGGVHFGIRLLTLTDLGIDAPVRLVERHGNLLFELYNYDGPEKTFWEQACPGSFFQGLPQCGFYLELGEREEYSGALEFGERVSEGLLLDECDPPSTYHEGDRRIWQVGYARDNLSFGLEVDLMTWQLRRRWTQVGDESWPMLQSTVAKQLRKGKVAVMGGELKCGKQAAWVYGCKKKKLWAAGYHGRTSKPLTFDTPQGTVTLKGMATGTIVWDDGLVTIEATGIKGKPKVDGGELVELVTA